MTRPYSFDPRAKAFAVPLDGRPAIYRRTRLAAGMSYTFGRRARLSGPSDDALRLMVQGTLARGGFGFLTERAPCPCCGSKSAGKLRLNDRGRLRLRTLRRRAMPDEAA